ncbi:TonB-dependent receptor domain-containing protein [Pontibacter sp. SGAir0037]|uniref:TonB-dependent receptor domain-containing protein n=1 Tax=Pontibacter sp. SGAir0037 TaxID=2571030 RepID=UPI0010CCFA70|nr:TonB-dependent receptor [Pontibacter sp. SGAir0037]QCR23703.1 TonB-dependent receptor [Pontibacter sp. SGAir0037]
MKIKFKTFFHITSFFLLLPLALFAQQPAGNGTVTGTLQDGESAAPVGFANVVLLSARDSSLVTGATSKENGQFTLQRVPVGQYILRASMVGFPTRFVPGIVVTAENLQVALGSIVLRGANTRLNEVVVTAERQLVEFDLDKKVVNVQQDIAAQSGSIAEVLQNVPSVTVDTEGNVSMRGSSNVTVLVDGKRTALAEVGLDQIPASMIESVELITNPSSKYDPEGTSGIINIILKKDRAPGFNGVASVNAGTYENYNTSLNLNYHYNKWDFNAGYDFRRRSRLGNSNSFRTNYPGTDRTSYLDQSSTRNGKDISHNVRFGAEYAINAHNSVSASALYRTGDEENLNGITYRALNSGQQLDSLTTRHTFGTEVDHVFEYNLGYRRTFERKGQEWTADVTYFTRHEDEIDDFTQQTTIRDGLPIDLDPTLQNTTAINGRSRLLLQTDYVHPINENSRLEAGYRSSFQRIDNDNMFYNINPETRAPQLNLNASNHFVYDEHIHAAYANYSNKISSLSFQVGVRAEQTNTVSDQRTQMQRVPNSYFSLFPSLFLTQEFNPENMVQFSYSRRINRPNAWNLNPFIDYTDPSNIRSGNPLLRPEYINSLELGYLRYWDNSSFNTSLFYRRTNDQVQRFRTFEEGVTYTTFINLASSSSYGIELIGTHNPYKWWRLNGSVSGFRVELNDAQGDTEVSNSQLSWNAKLNSTLTVWSDLAIQVSANYRSPMADIQGRMEQMYSADLGLKKDVLQKKGTVSLRVTDVFNTRQFNFSSYGPGFEFTSHNNRQTRFVFLGFTYRLNTDEKNNREEREQGGDGGDDF